MVALLVTCLNMSSRCPGETSVPSIKLFITAPPVGEMPWHFTDLFRVHICISPPNLIAIGCCIAEIRQCLSTGHASRTLATNYIEKQMHALLLGDLNMICTKSEDWMKYLGYGVKKQLVLFKSKWQKKNSQDQMDLYIWWMFCEGCSKIEFGGYVNILAKCFSPTYIYIWAFG